MSLSTPDPRPPMVTVLGWISIVSSAATIVLTPLAIAVYRWWWATHGRAEFEALPAALAPLLRLLEEMELLLIVQMLLSGLTLWAGVEFLRLRPWSRTCLELASWITVGLCVALGLFLAWAFLFGGIIEERPDGGGPPIVAIRVFAVSSVLMSAVSAVALPAVFIWLLRGRFVRPYFR